MHSNSTNKTLIERSANSLHTLYTVVIALALAEAVTSLLHIGNNRDFIGFNSEYIPTFIAFIVTIIPFYHGASRYLDEIYISKIKIRPFVGLIDFIFFFIEATFFYLISLLISKPQIFFYWLAFLFIIDIFWLLLVKLFENKLFKKVKHWFWLNLLASIIVLLVNFIIPECLITSLLLVFILLSRSFLDYYFGWNFYWPTNKNK